MATADEGNMGSATRPVFLLLAMGLSGCLEMEQTVVLEVDGSGRQKVHLALSGVAARTAKNAAAATYRNGDQLLKALEADVVRKELEANGLELVEHRMRRRGSKRVVDLEASFASLAGLRKSPILGSGTEWDIIRGPRQDLIPPLPAGEVRVIFLPRGKKAWQDARAEVERMRGGEVPPTRLEAMRSFFAKQRSQLQGLRLTLHLQLPGEITRHSNNLSRTAVGRVTASIQGESFTGPEHLVLWMAPRFLVDFKDPGVRWWDER